APAAAAFACEELAPRRLGELPQVESRRGQPPFELGTAMHAAGSRAVALDGLQPAPPDLAQAQRDTGAGEVAFGCVVVLADKLVTAQAAAGDGGDRRVGAYRRHGVPRCSQLEFDLFGHGPVGAAVGAARL